MVPNSVDVLVWDGGWWLLHKGLVAVCGPVLKPVCIPSFRLKYVIFHSLFQR